MGVGELEEEKPSAPTSTRFPCRVAMTRGICTSVQLVESASGHGEQAKTGVGCAVSDPVSGGNGEGLAPVWTSWHAPWGPSRCQPARSPGGALVAGLRLRPGPGLMLRSGRILWGWGVQWKIFLCTFHPRGIGLNEPTPCFWMQTVLVGGVRLLASG